MSGSAVGASAARARAGEGDVNATAARRRWYAESLDDATRDLLAADADLFIHQALSTPCLNVVRAAEGATIIDESGRSYLDFHANAVNQVGYANPVVIAAIRAQLDQLVYSPRRYTNRPAIELARQLVSAAPADLRRVLFTTSGATAVSAAVQLARVATGRHKTISLWDSFHGGTLDTISLGGEASFRNGIGPLMPGTEHVPPPDPWRCPLGCRARAAGCDLACASYLAYVLEHEGDVAAVVAETVRTTPVVAPPGWWHAVREACDRSGTMLILDEIPNGLGRTGDLFSCVTVGVRPDILVVGKGLGGGVVPLAAVLASERLNVAGDRSIGHFTHEKSPVAAAAGLAVLGEIIGRDLPSRAAALGVVALERLRVLADRHPVVGEVRGLGLLLGVVIGRTPDDPLATRIADEVLYAALRRGLSFKVTSGCILQLTPPLTVTEEDLDRAIEILDDAIGEVERDHGLMA